ncbi:hypothetical protein PVAP13_5NG049424 [Panicum virgatum]|uniref:Uncharacterized protein n=1 Tax=Panicum virgatum TaxID=38727 RepID=A0A8T0RLC4_PANVG|nr:hypothetical protein PVAP13_5NG049424 [Panicum virgatum]
MATPMPQICHHRRAACSHSRMPVITRLPAALGQETAAMRKGAAVGAGPVSERQPPRIHASRGHPSPLPTAPRRIAGLWPGDGAAATGVGVGDRGGRVRGRFWSGAWSGNAGSEPPLMDFFGLPLMAFPFPGGDDWTSVVPFVMFSPGRFLVTSTH